MTQNTAKAQIIRFDYAGKEIEGLLLPDGTKVLALSQVADIFAFDKRQAARTVKTLLGNELTYQDKIKTEIQHRLLNVVTINELNKLTFLLATKGNSIAIDMYQHMYPDTDFKYISKRNIKKPNYLYVFYCHECSVVKIGVSIDVAARFRTISASFPFPLSILYSFKTQNAYKLERKIHSLLSSLRLNGEWFDSSALQIIDWSSFY